MRKSINTIALAVGTLFAAAQAHALPNATLTFAQPNGTVNSNQAIEVWVDMTIDANGPALVFNPNDPTNNYGLAASDMNLLGSYPDGSGNYRNGTITAITNVSLGMWFGCSSSFSTGCTDGGAYNFTFADTYNSTKSFNSLLAADGSLNLAAGSTTHFLFGTFAPNAGNAPAGNYSFYRATLGVSVSGTGIDSETGAPALDSNGAPYSLFAVNFPYQTCNDYDATCAFTRTVLAVPEPETYAMFLAGLGLLTGVARRRRV